MDLRSHKLSGPLTLNEVRKRIVKVRGPLRSPCWVWQGSLKDGYGRVTFEGKTSRAHVAVYILVKGPYEDGLDLDHLCRNRACVNPTHLEPVTRQVNLLRGKGIPAKNAAKTHCPSGHPYSEENTAISRLGQRYCKTCKRQQSNASYHRRVKYPE